MNDQIVKVTRGGAFAAILILFLFSCQDDLTPSRLSTKQQAFLTARDNAQLLIATQEALDIAAGALEDRGVAQGRTQQGAGNDNFGCTPSVNLTLNIDRNHADSIIYSGSIIINYGDGASCSSGNRRTGRITDNFNIVVSTKKKLQFSSSETLTFEGFSRDDRTYDGVLIVSSANGRKTSIEGNKFATAFEDGTTSSWSGKVSFAYEDLLKRKGELRVSGSMSGTSRQATSFSANITEEIVFKYGCAGWTKKIPVDGTISITTDGATSVLNYGDGTCDSSYLVTVNGEEQSFTFH